jgi:hypothetical protein
MAYKLEITTRSGGTLKLKNVKEFTSGYSFFYVRDVNGNTTSFERTDIAYVKRVLRNGDLKKVRMKKSKL